MNGAGCTTNKLTPHTCSPGMYTAMRKCTGQCGRRRSIAQFVGDGSVCKLCRRRSK